ncbi:uncharacterized protein FMAN_00911 [Fusarium mangiferae]|uniref:Uncharacterized protein n=1 Tax=Fusarium mangiferae TaxID=192010 RepID=A0A1L7SJX4_FUSMA|nr:uncharacterized protein FMAN_00911 [Fusarium mangiferae]CVK83476.1 uncharacterized protein FMAN_00911 [Fusarium mangiferae]
MLTSPGPSNKQPEARKNKNLVAGAQKESDNVSHPSPSDCLLTPTSQTTRQRPPPIHPYPSIHRRSSFFLHHHSKDRPTIQCPFAILHKAVPPPPSPKHPTSCSSLG